MSNVIRFPREYVGPEKDTVAILTRAERRLEQAAASFNARCGELEDMLTEQMEDIEDKLAALGRPIP